MMSACDDNNASDACNCIEPFYDNPVNTQCPGGVKRKDGGVIDE